MKFYVITVDITVAMNEKFSQILWVQIRVQYALYVYTEFFRAAAIVSQKYAYKILTICDVL